VVLVEGLEFDRGRLAEAAADPTLRATDAAEELVRDGVPFRDTSRSPQRFARDASRRRPNPHRKSLRGQAACAMPALPPECVSVLELFPDTAAVADGELTLGGISASELADEFGTPLVLYCEQTLRACAEAYG
jgi:hypothetical protein